MGWARNGIKGIGLPATTGRWWQRHKAAVQVSSVYAEALYFDVPLFTII